MKKRVYEVQASIILRFEFEIDASNKNDAYKDAENTLKNYTLGIKNDYDSIDIDIEQITESEGH